MEYNSEDKYTPEDNLELMKKNMNFVVDSLYRRVNCSKRKMRIEDKMKILQDAYEELCGIYVRKENEMINYKENV